jgi:iron complex outermembrane receptor protein
MRKRIALISALLLAGALAPGGGLTQAAPAPQAQQETQQQRISGTVRDSQGPVVGATVSIKGTTRGTITDMDGHYSLNAAAGETLSIAFVGYATQNIRLNKGQSILNVTLKEENQALDEVIVTALGMKRDKKALGYAATELKGDELNTNLINPVSALQGKVAGVQISNSDGGMFGSTKILIRGVSTLGKNQQPIYVVDGVILSDDIKDGDPDWSGNPDDFGNELKNLNPDDFESVTVLKGAAATALYGSRGMNGAIVITTKSGHKNQGIGLQVSQTLGIDAVTSAPDLQNTFGPGYLAGYLDYGKKDPNGNYYVYDNYNQFFYNADGKPSLIPTNDYGMGFGPAFDGKTQIEYYDGTYRPYAAQKNNFKDAYQTGFNTNTNVALNGGNDKTTFYTSLSLKHATGIVANNQFDRFSFLGKVTHDISKTVKVDVGFSFANSWPKNPLLNIGENFASGTWNRMYDPKYSQDKYLSQYGGVASTSYGDKYGNMPGANIWFEIYKNSETQKETSVRPSVKLEWSIFDWLKWNVEGNYNYYYTRYEKKTYGEGYGGADGAYAMSLTDKEQTNANTNLVANKTWGDWTVNGFLRGEYYENFQQYQQMATNGGLIVPNQFFIANSKSTPTYTSAIQDHKKIFSLAFQAGFSWKDQIYVDVTGRNDWSSSLVYADKHGNYSYFYPSINGSILLTSMFRDQLPRWISFAKIRGSWAEVGNDTDPYTINSAYTLNTSTNGAGSSYYGMSMPTSTYDNNLKPERKKSWEVGIDWRFVNNRFGIDATYYKENTYDQIMSISVPYQSGITNQLVNAGNIQNRGFEIAVNLMPVKTRDWEWDLSLNWTKNFNKIISLHPNVANYIILAGDPSYGNYRIASVAKAGSSYGTLMTDSQVKIDPKSGLPMLTYVDSRRGSYLFRNEADIVSIGSIVPDFLGGLSTELHYKNWSLNVGMDMRIGGYVASYNSRYGTAYGFTKGSMDGAPGHGGITWTSKWDGVTYHDGVIPDGIIPSGTTISEPDGSTYTVGKGGVSNAGESYKELIAKGVIEPTHQSYWMYRNNAWTMAGRDYGVVSDYWVKKLNYIALRDLGISYRLPKSALAKLHSKGLTLTLAAHNLGYLLNSMPSGENPESVAGSAAGEFRSRSYQGVTTSYTFNINMSF